MKHIISLLLCVSMILLAGVAYCYAEDDINISTLTEGMSTVVKSGTCGADGDNLVWELDEKGVLTISGTGAMKDYYWGSTAPWENNVVTKAIIQEGVTCIGNMAFEECSSLTSIEIPSGVTSIGHSAFNGCSSLTSIEIPSGVTSIGAYTFYRCSSLTSISIPSGVTSIDASAFSYCSKLEAINVDSENTEYSSRDGVLYNKSKTEIILCPGNKKGTMTILSSVTSIGNYAFYGCSNLTSIEIPSGVTSIGYSAFRDCSSLTSIEIPSSVTSIGPCAFEECSSLTSIEIPFSVTNIDGWAFNGCSSLTSVEIPSSVTSIGHDAFNGCSSLTSIEIPSNVTSIGAYAFKGCSSLTSIKIPPSVTRIGNYAFNGCSSLTSIEIPSGVTSIGRYAFYGCSSLTNIVFRGTTEEWESLKASLDSSNSSWYDAVVCSDSVIVVVSYNANGGSVSETGKTVTYGKTYGTLPTPTYAGHTFTGWYTAASGGTQIISSTTVSITANQTLYAHWTANTYTVSYNANGGSVSESGKTVTYGSTYGTLPTPTYTGHTFTGWYMAASGGTQITSSTTVNITANQTLYAHWTTNTYNVTYSANGGTGTPSSQTKEHGVSLTLSSVKPSKAYVIRYNSNGGSVSPASKSVECTFVNWNTSKEGKGTSYASGGKYTSNANATLYAQWTNPAAGTLATPSRSGYTFNGWFTSAAGGNQITESSTITATMTIYAHWTAIPVSDPYNMGDETYSFANFGDAHSPNGHCFGMAMTSSGYHNELLDITDIGGNANTSLYSFDRTAIVKRPICYYQARQGSYLTKAIVAGGDYVGSDWQKVVKYVSSHEYDETGLLQIAFWKYGEGGHAVNFLRYENVNGQDRIYVYDNNFPTQETYFYRDSSSNVLQAPAGTFSGSIDRIALLDCRLYFKNVKTFNATHAVYMCKDDATIQGYSYSEMVGTISGENYVMYEIPEDQNSVIITPHKDNADFIYMDTEYSFGEINEKTHGELKFATMELGAVTEEALFTTFEANPEFGNPDFTLPSSLTKIAESAFEGIKTLVVYVPDTCTSIGAYAFRNSDVEQIRIPSKCTIADTAFDGCAFVQIFGKAGSPAETFCNSHDNCTFVRE